jgi:hypothetical protein
VGTFFLIFEILFYGVFVRFSTRGVQKHHKKLFGENPCQKLLAEKVEEKKNFFPVVFSHQFFFIVFLAVSLHDEPKTTIKIFSKIRPEISKNLKKKVGRYVCFFLFILRPLTRGAKRQRPKAKGGGK